MASQRRTPSQRACTANIAARTAHQLTDHAANSEKTQNAKPTSKMPGSLFVAASRADPSLCDAVPACGAWVAGPFGEVEAAGMEEIDFMALQLEGRQAAPPAERQMPPAFTRPHALVCEADRAFVGRVFRPTARHGLGQQARRLREKFGSGDEPGLRPGQDAQLRPWCLEFGV